MTKSADAALDFHVSCPIPISDYPHVLMAHGGGGSLMRGLITKMFTPAFDNTLLDQQHDGATFDIGNVRMAFTTDSFVVDPIFFPGGDIGSLAVHGTVNDLAMCGARPMFLSLGMIIEEGFPMEQLWRITQSIRDAAEHAAVQIVTGDTKVVDRGKGDGIYINTAGLGVVDAGLDIGPRQIKPGDVVIVSGDIGRHGIALMAVREGLEFETTIVSDSAPVADLVLKMLDNGIAVRCLRDLTRGGLASALVEISDSANRRIEIEERAAPVHDAVRGACEILGFDPLYVANEGRFVAIGRPVGCGARAVNLSESCAGRWRAHYRRGVRGRPRRRHDPQRYRRDAGRRHAQRRATAANLLAANAARK